MRGVYASGMSTEPLHKRNAYQDYEHDLERMQLQDLFVFMLEILGLGCRGMRDQTGEQPRIPEKADEPGASEDDLCIVRPYDWSDDEVKGELPNFVYKPEGLYLGWYKYPLRAVTASAPVDRAKMREIVRAIIFRYVSRSDLPAVAAVYCRNDDDAALAAELTAS
jgi:hypothetical protein